MTIEEGGEEEVMKVREDRVRVSDMVLLTNTPSEETKRVKLEIVTLEVPVIVNAVEVRETFTLVLDRPEMESGVDVVKVEVISEVLNTPFNRMIELNVEFPSDFNFTTVSIDKHGRSSHPHVLLSTPSGDGDTYILDCNPSPGVNAMCIRSTLFESESYPPIQTPPSIEVE